MKFHFLAGAAIAALIGLQPAQAASYVFNVTYSGGNVGVQGLGGDDILSTIMSVGDDFTYTLSADGAGEWKSLTGADIFPLIALPTNEAGDRNVDFSLTLFNNGASVFSQSGNENVSEVHIGTNELAVTSGLIFDQWVLNVVLNSAEEVGGGSEITTSFSDILPIFGPADINKPLDMAYSVTGFAGGAVPEPATWAMMISGFGLAGATLRRRRQILNLA